MEFANALYKQDERYDGECFVLSGCFLRSLYLNNKISSSLIIFLSLSLLEPPLHQHHYSQTSLRTPSLLPPTVSPLI